MRQRIHARSFLLSIASLPLFGCGSQSPPDERVGATEPGTSTNFRGHTDYLGFPDSEYPLSRADPRAQLPEEYKNIGPMGPRQFRSAAANLPPTETIKYDLRSGTLTRYTQGMLRFGTPVLPNRGTVSRTVSGIEGFLETDDLSEDPVATNQVATTTDTTSGIGKIEQPFVYTPDERARLPNTLAWPWRTRVKIYINWPNSGRSFCSGTMVGKKSVLTAAHCAYDADPTSPDYGQPILSAEVVPAEDGDYMPFGSAEVVAMWYNSNYANYNYSNSDYAILTLDDDVGSISGWMGLRTLSATEPSDAAWLNNQTFEFGMYDLDSRTDAIESYYMKSASGPMHWHDATQTYHHIDYLPGASGSGVVRQDIVDQVVAINAAEYDFGSGSTDNMAVKLITEVKSNLESWITAGDGYAEDTENVSGWTAIGGSTDFAPETTSIRNPHDVDILSLSNGDFHYYAKWNTNTGTWEGWYDIGGAFPWTPAAVSRATGTMDIFGAGYLSAGDTVLVTKAWHSGYGWAPSQTGWWCIGCSEPYNPVGQPTVISQGSDRMDVFVRNDDGRILHRVWTATNGWNTPYEVLGTITTDGRIAAVSRTPGVIDIVVRQPPANVIASPQIGTIYWNHFSGSSWLGWQALYSSAEGIPFGLPTLVSSTGTTFDLFLVGPTSQYSFSGRDLWRRQWIETTQCASQPLNCWGVAGSLDRDTIAAASAVSPPGSGGIALYAADRDGTVDTMATPSWGGRDRARSGGMMNEFG